MVQATKGWFSHYTIMRDSSAQRRSSMLDGEEIYSASSSVNRGYTSNLTCLTHPPRPQLNSTSHYCCGTYFMPSSRPYGTVAGPAQRRLFSSLSRTSRSFCTTTQQQQQPAAAMSAHAPPWILYARRTRARCTPGNRHHRPHASVMKAQCALTDWWPSVSEASRCADFWLRRYAVRLCSTQGQKIPVMHVPTSLHEKRLCDQVCGVEASMFGCEIWPGAWRPGAKPFGPWDARGENGGMSGWIGGAWVACGV